MAFEKITRILGISHWVNELSGSIFDEASIALGDSSKSRNIEVILLGRLTI